MLIWRKERRGNIVFTLFRLMISQTFMECSEEFAGEYIEKMVEVRTTILQKNQGIF